MTKALLGLSWSFTLLSLALVATQARATNDPNADIVYLRHDCSGIPDNCFTTAESVWGSNEGWIWTARADTSAPLLIDVGPGQFEQFRCFEQSGHRITVRGSGREHTVLRGGEVDIDRGAVIYNCTGDLEFIDIAFHGRDIGVQWYGGGRSVWTNTDIVALGGEDSVTNLGWFDYLCKPDTEKGFHYFFGSRVAAHGKRVRGVAGSSAAYLAQCSEVWFYGGEILIESNPASDGRTQGDGTGVLVLGSADFRAFGTAVRATHLGNGNTRGTTGVRLGGDQVVPSGFHMHGGIISVNTPNSASGYASGVEAYGIDLAHTPGTAFVINSGLATPYRASGNGVDSPFLWQSATVPPGASASGDNRLISESGEDLYIETDCDGSGDCDGAANEPHLMIYAWEECGETNPWFDVVTGRCRGTTGTATPSLP